MLSKNFIQNIKNNLLIQQQELAGQINQEIGVDIDGDETDEIQGNMLLEVTAKIFHRNNDKIKKINQVLSKIDNDVYGICEDCEEVISERRLTINPCFDTCVTCAEFREKEEKQRRRP